MPVDDAYSLETTLSRIRQRYAIHFYLPEGARAGEERNIEVELADATRGRYPGADVRYRRSYYAPSGAASSGATVVSRAGDSTDNAATNSTADDPDRPRMRRRPAVSQPDSSHDGPVIRDQSTAPSNSPAPSAQPAPPPPSNDGAPSGPGWRKARPEDLPGNSQPH